MGVTIRDVAARAGVATGTVSKFINGIEVKESNRIKIAKAIEELHFIPNGIAKGLRNSKSYSVGVFVPTLRDTYIQGVLSSIEHFFFNHGYTVLICESEDSNEIEVQKLRTLCERKVDGVIMLPTNKDGSQLRYLKEEGIPFVLIDRLIDGIDSDAIVVNNHMMTYSATKYAISKGHQRIALLCGPKDHFSARGRKQGFFDAMKEAGLEDQMLTLGNDYTVEAGRNAIRQISQMETRPTMVINSNYDLTFGALMEIRKLGWKIPDDISFIGADFNEISLILDPPIDYIIQPLERHGIEASSLLLRRMSGDWSDYPNVVQIDANFVVVEAEP